MSKDYSCRPESVGFNAADKILRLWGASPEQCSLIFGLSQNELQAFRETPEKARLNHAHLERVSCLLRIHASLRTLFNNTSNISRFMRLPNHNEYFNGQSPLELISTGKLATLKEVASMLEELSTK